MTLRSLFANGTLLAVLISGHAAAQSISAVASSNDQTVDATVSACVGSVLTIDGSGFGTAKPKVFLTDVDGKKYLLKVTAFTDVQITAEIKKAVAGELTLNVLPKGVTVPATSPVTIEVPVIGGLEDPITQDPITSADSNTEFVISGEFFGTKKGKIKIGLKAAKVLSWLDGEIHVIMPKSLTNGLWDILLDNKVAIDNAAEIITTNSPKKLGKASLTITFGTGPSAQTIHYAYTGSDADPNFIGFGGTMTTFPQYTTAMGIFFDVNNTPVPADFSSDTTAGMFISFTKAVKISKFLYHTANWLISPLNGPGLLVHITTSGGGQVGGTFTADVPLLVDTIGGEPSSMHIEGEFIAEIP